jgi:hypothetical protein
MPRKSASSLTLAPPVALRPLPEPPEDLTEGQAALWHQIVATKPADWWDASNLPMLRALVVHSSAAQVLDEFIAKFEPAWLTTDEGLERYERLGRARSVHTGKIESLMTKMRLTQQSRYGHKQAHTAAERASKSAAPWGG